MEDPKIYAAISNCMSEISAIGKTKKNNQQGFLYRGIDDVMNAINPVLTKNHVFIAPQVLEQKREERTSGRGNLLIYSVCRVKFTFYAEDGSYVDVVTVGEGMDSGDKATNKAMSIAFKYACFQVFCIPTEEMKDPDAESYDLNAPSKLENQDTPLQRKERDAVEQSQPEVRTPEQIIQIHDYVTAYAGMCSNADEKDIYHKLRSMFGFNSTEDLTKEQADKIIYQLEVWYQKKKQQEETDV